MFERFTKDAKQIVMVAEKEAKALGSPSIEAEHLLLGYTSSPASSNLAAAGLDRGALLEAIESDFETSLRAVGVSEHILAAAPRQGRARKPSFGASSRTALEKAYMAAKERGSRRIEASHVAHGVLSAKRGTVPHALRSAGFELAELREKVLAPS